MPEEQPQGFAPGISGTASYRYAYRHGMIMQESA
jgi:hypothetical protein